MLHYFDDPFFGKFQLVYDNEGGEGGEGGDKGGEGGDKGGDKGGSGGTGGEGAKSYNQSQLNQMMADNRRKLTIQNEKLVGELTTLKDQANLTGQEKTELEGRIEKLQEQSMSKEEIAKREATKAIKAHTKELDN